MTTAPSTGGAIAPVVATLGALVFVVSLTYGAWSYAWRFGVLSPSVSIPADVGRAATNVLLFTLFALHHSVFARAGIRRWVAESVSPRLERSAYVWIASLLFLAVVAAWRPVGGVLWQATGLGAVTLSVLQVAGVGLTLRAASAIDVLSLAGLHQAFGNAAPRPSGLKQTGLYRLVRHPLYFGWAIMVWATPTMTGTRLVFAATSTLYLVLAIPLEERSLRREFGEEYDQYATRVRWRMVWGVY